LALSVIAAIQPWSAAGAEKPMTTFVPAAALALSLVAVFTWAVFRGSLLVQAVSRAPAPTAALPNKRFLLDRTAMAGPNA
jgi:hypothetical protein